MFASTRRIGITGRIALSYKRLNVRLLPKSAKEYVVGFLIGPFLAKAVYTLTENVFSPAYVPAWFHELKFKKSGFDKEAFAFSESVTDLIISELKFFEETVEKDDFLNNDMTKFRRPNYNFYVSNDFNTYTFGSSESIVNYKISAIFYPYFLVYEKLQDVEKSFPKLATFKRHFFDWSVGSVEQPIPWSSPVGARLMESLVLSPEAKRYVIRRELYKAASQSNMTLQTVAAVLPGFVAGAVYDGTHRLKSFLPSAVFRHLAPLACCLLVGAVVAERFVKSTSVKYEDKKLDLYALHDENYKRGAMEYFEKCLIRNQCLKEIMEKDAKPWSRDTFSSDGNETSYVGLPFTERLSNVRQFKIPIKKPADPDASAAKT